MAPCRWFRSWSSWPKIVCMFEVRCARHAARLQLGSRTQRYGRYGAKCQVGWRTIQIIWTNVNVWRWIQIEVRETLLVRRTSTADRRWDGRTDIIISSGLGDRACPPPQVSQVYLGFYLKLHFHVCLSSWEIFHIYGGRFILKEYVVVQHENLPRTYLETLISLT